MAALVVQNDRQVVERHGDIGMLAAEQLLANRQCSVMLDQRFFIPSLVRDRIREVVE